MTTTNLSSADALKVRVAHAKPKLPLRFRDIFYKRYPEFNSAKGSRRVENVLALKASDEKITEALEALALEHQDNLMKEVNDQLDIPLQGA